MKPGICRRMDIFHRYFYDSYFQRYPHNHPVTILLYWVLKAAGKLGVSGLYWPSHLLGLVSIDLALLFMWKLACETEDIHRGFLVAVLSLFDPIIYIWIPWHYTTVCLLPFLSAGIYFGWKTWKAVNLRSQIIYAACTGIFTAVGMRIRITEGILLIAFLIMAVCVKRLESVQTGCMSDSFSGDMWSDLGRDRHASKSLCRF